MELKYFYAPKTVYTVCTGISVSGGPMHPEGPIFYFQQNGRRIASAINARGVDGLIYVAQRVRDKGYTLPIEVGEAVPFNHRYIRLCKGHVELRLPNTQRLGSPRLTFQFRDSFGSFNSAVKSALRTLKVYETVRGGLDAEMLLLDELEAAGKLTASQTLDHYRVKAGI